MVQKIEEFLHSSFRGTSPCVSSVGPGVPAYEVTPASLDFLFVLTAAMNMYSLLGSCTLDPYFFFENQMISMHPKRSTTTKAAHPTGSQSFSWQQSWDSGLKRGKYVDERP